jgi:GNAT superfamily N-acetyltransferase
MPSRGGDPGAPREWRREGYAISTDPERLDLDAIHGYLAASYWATGIPRAVLARALDHSLNFGIYQLPAAGGPGAWVQAGFGRVITDYTTFGYLADVFVLEPHRGRGLSKWLMACIDEHPHLKGFRRWVLLTRDAHGLYRQFGYTAVAKPDRYMERHAPDVYRRGDPPR